MYCWRCIYWESNNFRNFNEVRKDIVMQKLFSKKPSLEEFVKTYEKLMAEDFEKVMQENFSETQKEIIGAERELSFEVLEDLLASTKAEEN